MILDAGVDLFVVETMMSLQECRAAVIAIRELCDLPAMVLLTYNEDGRTLYGTDPATAVVVLQSLRCRCRGNELLDRTGGDDGAGAAYGRVCDHSDS